MSTLKKEGLKIALLCGSLCGGGAERFTVTMANRLSKEKKICIYLITENIKENEYSLAENITRECLLQDKRLISDAVVVYKFLMRECIDIAIGVGIYTNLVLCLANFRLKTKVIICETNDPKNDAISWKSRLMRKLLYPHSDYYVFQTQEEKQYYSKKMQQRGFVIHNPIKDGLPLKSDICNKEIVALGRLYPQKNYPMLLNAFRLVHEKHSEYILRIFGEGRERMGLEELAVQLKIQDFVVFEGFCLDAHEKMADSDIFVMSSDFEGMPNALMEAMAMGFPVVVTDCPAGGPAELIENKKNGLLVKVGDPVDMAEKINFLIENTEVKHSIAQNAILIRETHGEEEIFKQWFKILQF
ncbi:MAG: glycosyltransferase family 4 protein [Eubacterium sp.]|nr:glycosyltransferase family 4 protein [Eubacterium sp.]